YLRSALMPRVLWPIVQGRPCVQIVLNLAPSGQPFPRTLLADTGAGSQTDPFQLILTEDDCLRCGGCPLRYGTVGGAYTGTFPIYELPVRIPALGFQQILRALAV